MKKQFLFFLILNLYGEFQENNTLCSQPLASQIKHFLVDEGIKNISWSILFGFSAFEIFETINSTLPPALWGKKLKFPVIAASVFFPFIYNGIRYFQFSKNKNLIDKIAEEEESLVVSIEKNSFFDKRGSYFAPNKKKLLARTLFYLSKSETASSIPEIVAKLERKSKEEVFEYYKSFFDSYSLDKEIIIQEEIEKYLHGLLLKFKKSEEMTFSDMTQIIRLFLEDKKNIQSNNYKLRFLILDKSFLNCIENKIKEYQESYPIIFLTKNLKCQTQEKAFIVFFALLEIANKNFYLISPILDVAKESLYFFLKINNIENSFLQHLKNLEEEKRKIIEFERTIPYISDQINLYQNSLNTFVSTIKIKNDSVKRLQESIKIQIKRDNDDGESTIDAELKIKLLMDEIAAFEVKIKSYEKLITNSLEEIHRLREKIDCSYSLIKKYKDFLMIVSEIIYYGEDISKKN